jgi:hypothetical protein
MEETLNTHRNPIAGTKLIVGLFFTVVGVLMTADNLDLFDAWYVLRWWPAVILLVGVLKLADPGRRLVGVILTVLGALLLASNLEWWSWRFSISDLWPLLLIGAGVAMVARAFGVRTSVGGGGNIVAILGVRKAAPREFDGARIAAVMGGVELDLSEANLARSPAIIECFAMWAGIEITVPDGWEVVGELVPIMGGFEVSTAPAADPQRQLIVRGLALMGGIEVKGRKP